MKMAVVTRRVTLDVPEEVWNDFVRSVRREATSTDEVLLSLIRSYPKARREEPFEIAEITRAYLSGRLERRGSINDIDIDSEEVEKAIVETFGISDPVELIEKLRSSRW
jgi:hypothetical protein